MLRGMVLENFVQFKKRCKFDFSKTENGPNLFVGSSSTGKTAALELIRRCMDCKINSSLTKRFNPEECAYVFCEFKNDTTGYGPIVITGMIVEGKHKSVPDSIPEDEEYEDWNEMQTKNDTRFHKVVMYSYNDEIKFCSKTYLEMENGHIIDLRMNKKLSPSLLNGILDTQTEVNNDINKGIKEDFTKDFAKKVVQQIEQEKEKTVKSKPQLWREMEENFVGIFTMRGMGTFQWTKSPFIDNAFKSINYEGTCAQAEIITHLLDNELIDKEKEERLFEYLTGQEKFKFQKTTSPTGYPVINVECDQSTFPLLKTSLGIIEAKQFSLLMAHKKFKTICLEEPDRGMHPHMIERMKDVLHQQSKTKTIIVATHSPYLLDSRSLDNTFIFYKTNNESCAKKMDLVELGSIRKIIEIEDLKRLLFSSHVLFVEGKSDKIVLQSMFTHIFFSKRNELDMLSYDIVQMGGKTVRYTLANFCKSINIKHCFILDRDACETTNKNESSDGSNTFFWTKGELEDFLLNGNNANEFENIKTKCFGKLDLFADDRLTENQKIKKALNAGLSMDQSEKLADFIKDFPDTRRLRKFFEDTIGIF